MTLGAVMLLNLSLVTVCHVHALLGMEGHIRYLLPSRTLLKVLLSYALVISVSNVPVAGGVICEKSGSGGQSGW